MDGSTAVGLCVLGAAVAAGLYVLWGPESATRKKGKCLGLLNLGNTCFLNAVLQALAPAGCMLDWLQAVHGGKLTIALQQTLQSLRKDGRGVISPAQVLQALSWHGWCLDHQQQDAHELYQVFLTTLREERVNCPSLLAGLPPLSTASESVVYSRVAGPISTISQAAVCPLQGLLTSELVCLSCQHTSPVKYEVFDSLSLNLPVALSQCSLHSCLLDFIKSELVGDVECCKCSQSTGSKVKRTFMKQLRLSRPPSVLCLHLKRTVWLASGSVCKNDVNVTFPLHLDLSFLSRSRVRGSKFELVAMIEHLGGPFSGHYVTYRRLPVSGGWAQTSDSTVYSCNLHHVLNASPYMLFYSKVKNR